jgi:hypothetical protein
LFVGPRVPSGGLGGLLAECGGDVHGRGWVGRALGGSQESCGRQSVVQRPPVDVRVGAGLGTRFGLAITDAGVDQGGEVRFVVSGQVA